MFSDDFTSKKGVKGIERRQKTKAVALLSADMDSVEVAKVTGINERTVRRIGAANRELIRQKSEVFREQLLDRFSEQILRFMSFITDEKLQKASGYQLAGMIGLFSERYREVLNTMLPSQQVEVPQNLTLVQINEGKGKLEKGIIELKEQIGNLLAKGSRSIGDE